MRTSKRATRAATLVETISGCMIIIPIFFLLADSAAVLIGQTQNDALAKHAARAAAEQADPAQAQAAAQQVLNNFNSVGSNLCKNVTMTPPKGKFIYDTNAGNVLVVTDVTCYLLAPMPFYGNKIELKAEAWVPIVALAP
jgi:hypothetical protein